MTIEEKIVIKNKFELIELGKTLGNVLQTCKLRGYSRDGFYQLEEL